MTLSHSNTPLNAELIDGDVVITGPENFNATLSLEAARASLASLQRALDAADPAETYQKPLG